MAAKTVILRETYQNFFDDDALTLAAALAFYSALSLAPLLIILFWMASFLGEKTQQDLVTQIVGLIGEQAGQTIKSIVDNADKRPSLGNLAGVISMGALAFSAAGVFGQLQHALNIIWDVEAKPERGIWSWLQKRMLSVGMVLAIGFLLLVSLTLSALLTTALTYFQARFDGHAWVWLGLNNIIPFFLFTLLFGLLFKYLPDVRIAWADVWAGATTTSLLFVLGKSLIGLYLGKAGVGSAYGAAGSLIALLVWVYYSSLILFFGAEMTQSWAQSRGRSIIADEHAVPRKVGQSKQHA